MAPAEDHGRDEAASAVRRRPTPRLRRLGRVEWSDSWAEMRAFTVARTAETADEIWLCEHPAIYTLGVAGRPEHLLDVVGIPVARSDRGGQVTYHGPGQVVAYPLIDLGRLGLHVKEYVYRLEQAVLRTLEVYGVTGHRVAGAPGIYVKLSDPFGHGGIAAPAKPALQTGPPVFTGLGKIAALGIKVSRHCSYHGLALNVAMDLEPFERINPCGYAGLQTVDLSRIGVDAAPGEVAETLAAKLVAYLSP